jgi:protein-serine/threonine kinase
MAHRLTRMFSRTDQKDVEVASTYIDRDSTDHPRPSIPTRQDSQHSLDKKVVKDRTPNGAIENGVQHKRFEVYDDGSHAHFLKSTKRQEKLTGMLRDMLGGKKKEHDGDQQLSLMSSWIDQLRSEKDNLASEKKGGPHATANLVDKYGECQEVVGRGAFGIVRISHKQDPTNANHELLYAVKEFRRRPQETNKKYQKRLTSEFCISSSLRHPKIIRTLDLMQDDKGDFCEVMEYCAGGDLYTLILAAQTLVVAEADCFFKQLMRGVEYMHEMGVAHRDLKPENLLLTTHGTLKITDFGNGECFRMAWEKEAHLTAGLCGSAPYIAPEEYAGGEFDPRAVDVWACGVIYMAMRTGRHLWRVARKDEDEFYEKYLEGRRDEDGYAPIESLHRVSLIFGSVKGHTNISDRLGAET